MLSIQRILQPPLLRFLLFFSFFFFNHPATTEIYTLSLHDALPISQCGSPTRVEAAGWVRRCPECKASQDRKSTRLNSSHEWISYAVFCLKKKNLGGKRGISRRV